MSCSLKRAVFILSGFVNEYQWEAAVMMHDLYLTWESAWNLLRAGKVVQSAWMSAWFLECLSQRISAEKWWARGEAEWARGLDIRVKERPTMSDETAALWIFQAISQHPAVLSLQTTFISRNLLSSFISMFVASLYLLPSLNSSRLIMEENVLNYNKNKSQLLIVTYIHIHN